MKAIILILLFPVCGVAQSVTMSPLSVNLWGKTPNMAHIGFEWKGIGLDYFHSWDTGNIIYEGEVTTINTTLVTSYSQRIKFVRVGVMYAFNKFPLETGTNLNFIAGLYYDFGPISIEYNHYSNGFGLLHKINPGVDFIGVRFKL